MKNLKCRFGKRKKNRWYAEDRGKGVANRVPAPWVEPLFVVTFCQSYHATLPHRFTLRFSGECKRSLPARPSGADAPRFPSRSFHIPATQLFAPHARELQRWYFFVDVKYEIFR